ncbi:MAG: deoxyuridine 5'-triphosphate nucleotidohydrolase, partial [Candidatus Micrarchaeia archaeon]
MASLPKHILMKRNIVRDYVSDEQFQPAGIDLTVEKVYKFVDTGRIDYDNTERKLSMVEELKFGSDGYVFLPKGSYK